MQARPSILIVDDDPVHLRIYGWIVEAAGYRALPAQARFSGVDLPEDPADLVLLDYRLGRQAKALLNVLGHNLAQYEQTFGPLALEPQFPPPGGPVH